MNAQRSTLNAQRSTLNAQRSTLNARDSLWFALQILPSAFLTYAGSAKLKLAIASFNINILSWDELFFNLIFPMIEIATALLLVIFPQRLMTISVIGLLTLYLGYLIRAKWSGNETCGCVGAGNANILAMIGLDLAALSILYSHRSIASLFGNFLFVGAVVLSIPTAIVFWMSNPKLAQAIKNSSTTDPVRAELQSSSHIVSRSAYDTRVRLFNRGKAKIEVKHLLVSCGCTSYEPDSFAIEPGRSQIIQMKIDLNKAYTSIHQSRAKLEIDGSLIDSSDNQIGVVKLFAQNTRRSFAIDPKPVTILWNDNGENTISIPIQWFEYSNQPIEALWKDILVGTASYPANLAFNLDKPKSSFEKRDIKLIHRLTPESVQCDAVVSIQVSSYPPIVSFQPTNAIDDPNSIHAIDCEESYFDTEGNKLSDMSTTISMDGLVRADIKRIGFPGAAYCRIRYHHA